MDLKRILNIPLLLIVVIAFILRVYDIGNNPKSMYGDELTLVYDAYSLLKTGKDINGERWPLFFSMGGGRPAGYIYATIPFTAIFGPTALSARLVSVLSGVGIVVLTYLILSNLMSKKMGLWGAVVAAITPWELNLSRGGFESHFALFLGLAAFYSFLLAKQKLQFYLLSALLFAASMQTYSTYVFTIPLFVILLIIVNKERWVKPKVVYSPFIIFSIFFIIASLVFSIYISYSRGSQDRFSNLLLTSQNDLKNLVTEKVRKERLNTTIPSDLANKVHNQYLEFMNIYFQNYINTFSPNFIILQGDGNPRHNPTAMGAIYWATLPMLIVGIVYLYKKYQKLLILFFGWSLIVPLGSSLVGPPHMIRNSFLLPPLIFLIAAGLYSILELKNKYLYFKISLLFVFILQLLVFLYRFYILSPNLNSRHWSYSAKIATDIAIENKNKYDYIILSTRIDDLEYAYPVYASKVNLKKSKTNFDEFQFIKYDNVYLGSMPNTRVRQTIDAIPGSVLYLGPLEDIGKVENEQIERDTDKSPLFVISVKNKI